MPIPREITIYDIARELNISAATVSRSLKDHPAISEKTKKKIQDTARQMGYRSNTFARNLRRQKTNTIGVIVPRLNSTFMSEVIAGMEKIANEAGYNLIISQSLEMMKKEAMNAATMFNNRVDGLLVSLAYDTDTIVHFEPFVQKNIPLLFFDRVFDQKNYSGVIINNYQAAYDITAHLLQQGCKNLMHITGNLSRNVYADRLKGFRQALADHQLPFYADQVIVNNLSVEEGKKAARQILQLSSLPDGVFVANDTCAVGCMLELMEQGIRIPQEVAFAGFNNDPISLVVKPNLTTVHYKGFEMGEIAAKTLIRVLNESTKHTVAHTIVLPHELIIRPSSLRYIAPRH
jgi:LacI family transcriptional regulator